MPSTSVISSLWFPIETGILLPVKDISFPSSSILLNLSVVSIYSSPIFIVPVVIFSRLIEISLVSFVISISLSIFFPL